MLRRLPSVPSISSLLRPASTSAPSTTTDDPSPTSSRSRSLSSSSALDDALASDIIGIPPVPRIDLSTVARAELIHSLEALQAAKGLEERLQLLAKVQHVLTDQPDTRNSFREHGGFLNAVSVLASLEIVDQKSSPTDLRLEVVTLVFQILALALNGHDVNRAAFAESVGFEAVAEAIKLSQLMLDASSSAEDSGSDDFKEAPEEVGDVAEVPTQGTAAERIISILYSFLTNDFAHSASSSLFAVVRRQLEALDLAAAKGHPSSATLTSHSSPPPSRSTQISLLILQRADSLQDVGGEAIEFAEVVPLLLNLQAQLGVGEDKQEDLSLMLLCALRQLAGSSRRSQVALSEAGVLGIGLERLFPSRLLVEEDAEETKDVGRAAEGSERELWMSIVERLLELGADTSETRRLFQCAVKGWEDSSQQELNENVLELILGGVRKSRVPSFIHFDLSRAGHSSLTMRSLGRAFPPPTHGYTFLAWLSIDVPPSPSDERLVIFGGGDATGKCHVEIGIDPNLNLTLSTSLAKPPIVFKEFTFSRDKFHHVAIVHQRPRYALTAPVSLYVDGKLVETAKAPYPIAPPKEWEVQCWLGTPKDRVPEGRLGKGRSGMKWDLGPTWLLATDVPEDLVFLFWSLGPRYTGNFQDQLGQFMTNAASTALNLRLDTISRALPKSARSTPANSPLVTAIRDKGSLVIPEHKIYFAFSALNVLGAGSDRGLAASGLSEHARQALALTTASKGKTVLNSAIPGKVEEALTMMHGLGQLAEACVVNPKQLDVGVWKVGGVMAALRLVELAKSEWALEKAVELLCDVIGQSWRTSEDTERSQAYDILAHHLRAKASLITSTTHDTLLVFCGFDLETPGQSVVSNVLAVRHILLDFALWGATELQWAHLERLRELAQRSEHADFNLRRLSKMHLVRKLLFALRAGYFDTATLNEVVDLIMLIFKTRFDTESVRLIATYLTATLCQVIDTSVTSGVNPSQAKESSAFVDPSSFVLDARKVDPGRFKAPLRVLQALHDLLFTRTSELQKFAKIITTKWMLLFLLDRHAPPIAAVLALRILVRLLQSQGSAYVARFTNSTDGFVVLRGAVPHLWNYSQIHVALFALLHDHDISALSLCASFHPSTFLASAVNSSVAAPDVVRVIIACLGRGVKVVNSSGVGLKDGKETSGEAEEEEGETGTPATSPSLEQGFEIILELLSQANRATGLDNSLVASPVLLADLIAAVRPALRLPTTPEYPVTAEVPPLPLLSSRNGYRTAPRDVTIAEQSPEFDSLKLQIPSTPIEQPTSPLTAFEEHEDTTRTPQERNTITPTAASLVGFLGGLLTSLLTSRRSLVGDDSSHTDLSMQLLRDVLDAAACTDVQSQVIFRTVLVQDVVHRLSRASTAAIVAGRIAVFIDFATDLAVQGWIADVNALLTFTLSYVEKLLDDTALGSPSLSQHATPLGSLFKSLNRLVLLALTDSEVSPTLLVLLTRLIVFAPQNDDVKFINCLLYRLDALAQSMEDPAGLVDFAKLLILQRSSEVEAALGQQPRQDFEAPFINTLIDTDNESFLAVFRTHSEQLEQLKPAWEAFVAGELDRARPALEKELARMTELATTLKHRATASRRRVRRQRASIYEWSEGVHEVEATRVAHTRQDINDHAVFIQNEWADRLQCLQRGGGVWGGFSEEGKWALDFTEGYCRMRKKLQRVEAPHSASESGRTRTLVATNGTTSAGTHQTADADAPSPSSSPVTPQEEMIWTEEVNGDSVVAEDESAEEDKNRKVRRSLESGDVIETVFNASRIVGLDACSGLLLLAKKNLYIIDSFFQTSTGELVDAWDAPAEERDQHLQTLADLAGRTAASPFVGDDQSHRSRRWPWPALEQMHERKYLFRNVGLELFFADGRSFLLVFPSVERRNAARSILAFKAPSAAAFGSLNVGASSFSSKLSDAVLGPRTKLEQMTRRWERREVSNFEYLMVLNNFSGRTYSDLTNYPVLPWVLADYESETIDLTSPASFRDLSRPMGAQTEDRRKEAAERYSQLAELGEKPFHYGTHYSSAMIVAGYLVRLYPFTGSFLSLQGGSFDHADRMFWSIPRAWESCSKQSRSDVRELVPEFFYLPDFLTSSGLDLGTRQEGEQRIDNVVLPPWAKGDPRLFVELHREALESEHVSAHLHLWIDLLFGYKSGTHELAVEALNVFPSLSYEDSGVDLDSIENADERRAATSTIHNFGCTPKQLFTSPHPAQRLPLLAKATRPIFSPDLLIEQQAVALVESIVPVADLGSQISTICPSASAPDKTLATSAQSLFIPGDTLYSLSWGYGDQTMRIHAKGHSVPVSLFENLHSELVSAACFADARTLVTVSTDSTVSVWRWRWEKAQGHLQLLECLRGHTDQVTCVVASRAFSIVVSGSDDKSAIIWDLNRHRFVHLLGGHESRVQLVAISSTTGDVATCSGAVLRLWTVNGVLLATQATSNLTDPITAVAFSNSETAPIIATGHRAGRIMLWRREWSDETSGWQLSLIHTLKHHSRFPSSSRLGEAEATISALAFTARTLYSGDSDGRVWLWNPPGTELFLPDGVAPACMGCGSKFGLMESRRRCTGCAGVFCSLCTTTSVEVGGRFCARDFKALSRWAVI